MQKIFLLSVLLCRCLAEDHPPWIQCENGPRTSRKFFFCCHATVRPLPYSLCAHLPCHVHPCSLYLFGGYLKGRIQIWALIFVTLFCILVFWLLQSRCCTCSDRSELAFILSVFRRLPCGFPLFFE